jgi:hypothetical protein
MLLNARRVELQPGHPVILLAIEDVTQKSREGAAIKLVRHNRLAESSPPR